MKKEVKITLASHCSSECLVRFVHEANRFKSYILLHQDELEINAKGLLGILHLLNTSEGEELILSAEGMDAEQAVAHLSKILRQPPESMKEGG
ncbi:HPr family phosphocarrier protein [Ammoniphilus sp. CFH 90114]|uniref:HPr family phosphocarrier protein n=1 Tax=Ammoniphilus sp. CFH 90114 TaxID=2493665 RepID=UPI00100E171E|nr:HPr family phosphocarrier protein [Ammoniphilus sp. CFH 90114]RXT14844.1 HPr family phosphocarrier protein [Ammoniphilus sp. CFH 90114]